MEALLHATLPVLCEHLTVADVFRLGRALQLHDDDWPDDVPALLASRMHLRPQFDMRALSHKMRTTRRCVECGVPMRRPRAVPACTGCTDDPRSAVALCTRQQMREWYPHISLHKLRTRVPLVMYGTLGRCYYRVRDVRRVFGAPHPRL